MTDQKKKLLADFASAAGALTTEALNELNEEKRSILGQILGRGTASIRLTVGLSPLVIICTLHHAVDRTVSPEVLFRIEGDIQTGEFH